MRHLVIETDDASLSLKDGHVTFGGRRMAVDAIGSIQCFGRHAHWTQAALHGIAGQCPIVLSRWDSKAEKWSTCGLNAKARHINPGALDRLCRLSESISSHLASHLLHAKISNQITLLRAFDPYLPERPPIQAGSLARVLRLEASQARRFWARFFEATATALFTERNGSQHSPSTSP